MRAILSTAPWVSDQEKEAAEKVIDYLRSPTTQKILTDLQRFSLKVIDYL